MATSIVHRPTGRRYLLLGSSVHLFTPGAVVSSSQRPEGASRPPRSVPVLTLAVCDAEGTVSSLRAEECTVAEIDGMTPAAALQPPGYR